MKFFISAAISTDLHISYIFFDVRLYTAGKLPGHLKVKMFVMKKKKQQM